MGIIFRFAPELSTVKIGNWPKKPSFSAKSVDNPVDNVDISVFALPYAPAYGEKCISVGGGPEKPLHKARAHAIPA